MLAQRGHEVGLVHERAGGPFLARYGQCCRWMIAASPLRLRAAGRVELAGVARTAAWTVLRMPRPAVVYANDLYDLVLAYFQASLCRCPLVCHLRTVPHEPEPLDRLALRRVSRFVAVSEDVRRRFSEMGVDPRRIDVVRNGIRPLHLRPLGPAEHIAARHSLGVSPDAVLYVYAGRLLAKKGISVLVEAFARAAAADPAAQLVVLGVDASAGEVQDLSRSLRRAGVADRSQTLPASHDIRPMLGTADAVLVPSLWPEPASRVVLEAMACGVPPIASAAGGIPELLGDRLAELLVPPGDATALAARMSSVGRWREHRPALGIRCREVALASFTLERTATDFERSLTTALQGTPR